MLAFEVFIIHLSSWSGEGTCSVLLNYRIFFFASHIETENEYGRRKEKKGDKKQNVAFFNLSPLKGTLLPKMKILSSFTHPHAIPNL